MVCGGGQPLRGAVNRRPATAGLGLHVDVAVGVDDVGVDGGDPQGEQEQVGVQPETSDRAASQVAVVAVHIRVSAFDGGAPLVRPTVFGGPVRVGLMVFSRRLRG